MRNNDLETTGLALLVGHPMGVTYRFMTHREIIILIMKLLFSFTSKTWGANLYIKSIKWVILMHCVFHNCWYLFRGCSKLVSLLCLVVFSSSTTFQQYGTIYNFLTKSTNNSISQKKGSEVRTEFTSLKQLQRTYQQFIKAISSIS